MKKTFTFMIACSLLTIATSGQIKKGSVLLGGDIGGSTQRTKRDGNVMYKQNSIYISPVFGVAVKENLIVGADASVTLFDNQSTPVPETRQRRYGLGIFFRKYQPLGKSDFFIFLQSRLGGEYNSIEQIGAGTFSNSQKRISAGINIYPGLSYAVSRKLQVETGFNNLVSLSYVNEKMKMDNNGISIEDRTNGFTLNSSLNNLSSLYLGFRVLLN